MPPNQPACREEQADFYPKWNEGTFFILAGWQRFVNRTLPKALIGFNS
jgi:hypothetical protein